MHRTDTTWRLQFCVIGFTLDNSLGEFVLTHPDVKIPERGAIYSINEGNSTKWNEPTRKYVELVKGITGRKPYSLRYIGSMVADVHRTILYGGIFMYPADGTSPNGKLRYVSLCLSLFLCLSRSEH
jgi:fructose-1,6-bisphosphatase I